MAKYPFQISTAKNEAMGGFDMLLQMGGFKSKAEAEEYARAIVQFLEDNANATASRVQ